MTQSTRIRPSTKRNARDLRRNLTDAERALWRHLRQRQVAGLKFRRQHPIGHYILDFVCLEARLVIELDGGHHAERLTEDQERTAWLEARGYRVLRFWNTEVLENPEGVLEVILRPLPGLAFNPHPNLPPARGKGPEGRGGRPAAGSQPLPRAGGGPGWGSKPGHKNQPHRPHTRSRQQPSCRSPPSAPAVQPPS